MSESSGYPAPNHTQTPNALFEVIPDMSETELKVTLAIVRATFGWHKKEDKLSLSQLQERTGLSRQGVINGIEAGMKRGTIQRRADGQDFYYSLLVNEIDQSESGASQKSRPVDAETSQKSRPALVKNLDTQKKGKESKERNTSPIQEKPQKPKAPDPKPRPRNPLFDAICRVCDLDPDHLPPDTKGSAVGKVMKDLKAANWQAEDVERYHAWREMKGLGPLKSIHWLVDEMAKREWRGAQAITSSISDWIE